MNKSRFKGIVLGYSLAIESKMIMIMIGTRYMYIIGISEEACEKKNGRKKAHELRLPLTLITTFISRIVLTTPV